MPLRALRSLAPLLLTSLVACGGGGDDEAASPAGAGGTSAGAAGSGSGAAGATGGVAGASAGAAGATSGNVHEALAKEGFEVKDGAFRFLDLSTCCATSCLGNNPTSPYGAFFVPEGPGQTSPNPNAGADGLSPSFRLRADEAIVWVGKTPPKARYFGFTPYLSTRTEGGKTIQALASVSETENQLTLQLEGGGEPFDRPAAVVASMDQGTDQRVRKALVAAGLPAGSISSLVFDPTVVHAGLDAAGDTLGVLFRMAVPDDAAKTAAYRQNPGATLLRVTPTQPGASQPFSAQAARPKDTAHTEAVFSAAVDQLEAALIAKYPTHTSKVMFTTEGTPDPTACIAGKDACAYDNRDTIYPATLPQTLLDAPGEFLVVYGVNHALSGKASYANASVYGLEHLVGVASVTSADYEGSATSLLPGNADAPKLYAWTIARDCKGEKDCLEVPVGECPTGVPAGGKMSIAFRVYLEPTSKTAPDPKTLVADRVLRFTPK